MKVIGCQNATPNELTPSIPMSGDSGDGLPVSPCMRAKPNDASLSIELEITHVWPTLAAWFR